MGTCGSKRKLLVGLLASAAIFLFFGISVYADTYAGYVTADTLNVRVGAGVDNYAYGQLHRGDVVIICDVVDGWGSIWFEDRTGWVSLSYVVTREEYEVSRGAGSETGEQLVAFAKRFLGTPYRYGGSSPGGFDCSGFTSYCFSNFGVRLNRTASAQMGNGRSVSKSELVPGDLVFFTPYGGGSSIGHVGIYVGNGMMIHSPQSGDVVKYSSIVSGHHAARYVGARRIFE